MSTLVSAANRIATLASLTTNTTYAPSVAISWEQTSQTSRKQLLREFIEYGDAIAYVKPDTGVLWIIDILTGIIPAININNFEVKSVSGENQGKIIGKIVADLMIKEFNDGGINGRPSLNDIPVRLSLDTNKPSREEYPIKVKSLPTTLSGGQVVYSYTGINSVLTRKKNIYESRIITIEYNNIIDLQIGQRVNFDNTFEDDNKMKGSGAMTVVSRVFNTKDTKMTITGIGTFTEA